MEIENLSLEELKNIDPNSLSNKERRLLKKRKKFLKKQQKKEEKKEIFIEKENEKKRRKRESINYVIIFMVAVIIGYFLYSTVAPPNVVETFELTGETKEFTMTAKQWEFIPNTINVNQGDKVILNIESVDVAHGIALPQFNINEELLPGKTARVEFIADKKGKFSFICSVYCGIGHGAMKGRIIVK